MTRRPQKIVTAIAALAVLGLLAPQASSAAPTQDGNSLSELQKSREQVREKKTAQAGNVNALQADDAEATAALNALSADVRAQQDKVEEAQRAYDQAIADKTAAEQAQDAARAELDTLHTDIKKSAVDAYVNIGSGNALTTVGTEDINQTVNKRTLLEVQANDSQDLVEKFRSVEEDLELQRQAAQAAEARAAEQSDVVKERKAELDASYDRQEKFAAEIEERLNRSLAEAAALSSLDKELSNQINSKQQALAKAAAAAAAARKRTSVSSSGSSGGGSYTPPNITGSGSIVSVGGIRVHQSIAGNVQALLSAAAASGIHLSGGGYRDPAGQIAVRKSNCGTSSYAIYQMSASSCSPPTAKPGSSMHEQGLAIDFTQGGRTLTRSSSGYHWLRSNASSYGLQNLPSEAWHWSVNGR